MRRPHAVTCFRRRYRCEPYRRKAILQDNPAHKQDFPVLSVDVDTQLDFACKLRLVRTLLNWRQEGMAESFGVNIDTISAWETGRREPSARKQRLLIILGEREGLWFNERGYPEYERTHRE